MHLEVFASGVSILHKIDPRIKFIGFFPVVFAIALSKDMSTAFWGLGFAVVLTAAGRLNTGQLLSRIVAANVFVVFLWAFLPFNTHGRVVLSIGPLPVTQEGINGAISISVKTNAIILLTIAVLGTTRVFSLAHALVHLKVPPKLVYLFFFCYRYLTLLHEEFFRLKRAASIRAFRPGTNLHTYKTYAYMIGMLLVRSYERSERVYNAMLCRGFRGKFPIMMHFEAKGADYVFLLIMIIAAASLFSISV